MEPIGLPTKIELIPGNEENQATLVVEPCFQGYGTTLGNALRRVLLSSLPGAAVTAVKITGAQHEFSTLPHIKEDVLEIILNLKQLRLRVHSDEPVRLNLKKNGEGKVKAKDIEPNADVEIVNPDLHIATVTDEAGELEMEIIASRGRGFVTTEDRGKEKEIGVIGIDSIFTPVKSVGYQVVDTRVGQITNFDKLMLAIETDGTITPKDAIEQATRLLIEHLELFRDLSGKEEPASSLAQEEEVKTDVVEQNADEGQPEETVKKTKKKKTE